MPIYCLSLVDRQYPCLLSTGTELMPTYSVFGGVLDSEIAFDGLHVVEGIAATWRFSVDTSAEEWPVIREIGRERVSPALEIVLACTYDDASLLQYSAYGLGTFWISRDGHHIRWRPGADPWMAPLRWILMGRVMATAMYMGGRLCLHGSAVTTDGGAICFIAPKHCGKSTLAAALVAGGSLLLADDILPVHSGRPVAVYPGIPVLRLLSDSGEMHGLSRLGRGVEDGSGKARIDLSSGDSAPPARYELKAIYVLAPNIVEPRPECPILRKRLPAVDAWRSLIRHTSIAPLLSPACATLLLTEASTIVREVPVFELRTIRDLQRLPEVATRLREWHMVENAL